MFGQHVLVALAQDDQLTANVGVVEQKALGEIGHSGLACKGNCERLAILGTNAGLTKGRAPNDRHGPVD
ncbi:hypothetical protein D3C80_2037260 [compost metagenome]